MREYRSNQAVNPGDLGMVRRYLDKKGILEESDFERRLLEQAG
jgi:hypothetical protein